jgi:hypothetical protein
VRALLLAILVFTLAGCAMQPTPSHNAYGGYIPACGEMPPLVGDDC